MSNVLCLATVLDAVCSSSQNAFGSLSGLGVSGSRWRARARTCSRAPGVPSPVQRELGVTPCEKVTSSAEITTTSPV